MDEDDAAATVPRRWPQAILAVILIGVFLAAQLLSDRPQMPLKRPWIDHVADLPAGAGEARYQRFADSGGVLPTGRRLTVSTLKRAVDEASDPGFRADAPVRLGYSIKEYVALAMPFFAHEDLGYALYVDDGGQYMYFGPIGDEGLKLLRDETRTPIGEGFTFRWWNHMWGWIPLLALIGIIVLEIRRARIKRSQSGIL